MKKSRILMILVITIILAMAATPSFADEGRFIVENDTEDVVLDDEVIIIDADNEETDTEDVSIEDMIDIEAIGNEEYSIENDDKVDIIDTKDTDEEQLSEALTGENDIDEEFTDFVDIRKSDENIDDTDTSTEFEEELKNILGTDKLEKNAEGKIHLNEEQMEKLIDYEMKNRIVPNDPNHVIERWL